MSVIKKGTFMTDNEGNPSSMRLMSMMSLVTGLAIAGISVWNGALNGETIQLITILLLGGFAPKTVSKFAENKIENGG